MVLEVSSRRFVRGVLETADTTYRKLALAGSTREEMNQAVVVILDTNTIQLEKRVHRRTPGPFKSRCEVIRIQGYIIELMNPLKSASTSSLVVGVSITSTSESSTAMGGLPSDGFTGMDDDNSDVLIFFKGGRTRLIFWLVTLTAALTVLVDVNTTEREEDESVETDLTEEWSSVRVPVMREKCLNLPRF